MRSCPLACPPPPAPPHLRAAPLARTRPWARALVLAFATVASFSASAAPRAAAQADDPIGDLRQDAARLAEAGRYYEAVRLLRGVDLDSLAPDRAIELKGWIADLDLRRAKQLEQDLAEAERLRVKGSAGQALEVLDGVGRYGSPEDVARADALGAAIRKEAAEREAASEEARRAAEEEQRRDHEAAAEAARAGARDVLKLAQRWVEARKKLACLGCRGTGKRRCGDCDGRGKERVIDVYGSGTRLVDCRGCNAQGIVLCGSCEATGLTPTRFDDVLYAPFAPEVRKALGTKTKLARQVTDILSGKGGADPAVAEQVERFRAALEPVLGASEIEVRLVPGEKKADVRYAVATAGAQREERVRFLLHADGQWYLEAAAPTLLKLAPPAPAAPPAGGGGGR